MSSEQFTLNQIFTPEKLSTKQLTDAIPGDKLSVLKERLIKEARVAWPLACNLIVGKIGDLLNISVPDIMIAAWNKYRTLAQYTDKEKYPPDETYIVTLAEHTVTSEHSPSIEIIFNNVPIDKIDFDITFSLTFSGINLKIQDGKIMEVMTGTCKGNATVQCENKTIFEKETKSYTLPGSISLGGGVPIPKLAF